MVFRQRGADDRFWSFALPQAENQKQRSARLVVTSKARWRLRRSRAVLLTLFDHVGRPLEETVRRFLKMHDEQGSRLSATQGLDAAGIQVKSPFISSIPYPLGLSFDLALAHERRHSWQQLRRQLVGE